MLSSLAAHIPPGGILRGGTLAALAGRLAAERVGQLEIPHRGMGYALAGGE